MASIAYVSDRDMLEYHRLNGNTTINFWRTASDKKFTNFKEGDLLFFLSKSTAKVSDKSLLGYGRLKDSKELTINKMWDNYQTLNGFSSKEKMIEKIQKKNKHNIIPKMMSCLLLEDVVFFQAPIYLSEIDFKISKNQESYIYIDRKGSSNTSKILEIAKSNGVDIWSIVNDDGLEYNNIFEHDQIRQVLSNALLQVKEFSLNTKEYREFKKLVNYYLININYSFVTGSGLILYKIDKKTVTIIVPVINTNINNQLYRAVIGFAYLYKNCIMNNIDDKYEVEVYLSGKDYEFKV